MEGTTALVDDEKGKRVLRIVQANPQELFISTVRGSTEPVDGWYSTNYGKQTEATVLLYERKGARRTTPPSLPPASTPPSPPAPPPPATSRCTRCKPAPLATPGASGWTALARARRVSAWSAATPPVVNTPRA